MKTDLKSLIIECITEVVHDIGIEVQQKLRNKFGDNSDQFGMNWAAWIYLTSEGKHYAQSFLERSRYTQFQQKYLVGIERYAKNEGASSFTNDYGIRQAVIDQFGPKKQVKPAPRAHQVYEEKK
jgi:hypothetical protein